MKKIISLIVMFTIVMSMSVLSFAEETDVNVLPQWVIDEIEATKQVNEIPESRAWFEDLDGNITKTTTLELRKLMRVPDDGFTYLFDSYDPNNPNKNLNYKTAGTFIYSNYSGSEGTAVYIQNVNKTNTWNVASEISASATIEVAFVGAIESELSISGGTSQSYTVGQQYGSEHTVNPHTRIYITNWTVGGYDNGILVYRVYSGLGTFIGYHYENTGGTIVSENDFHFSVTDESL